MTRPVLVDTSALYALFAPADGNHGAAKQTLEQLRQDRATLLTSPIVLLEAYVLVHARTGRVGLLRFRETLARSQWLDVVPVGPADEDLAWALLDEHPDKDWSFVDASSFVVMRAAELTRAFTFDAHFAQAGFEMLPGSAKPARRARRPRRD